jgi:hypothetical protein
MYTGVVYLDMVNGVIHMLETMYIYVCVFMYMYVRLCTYVCVSIYIFTALYMLRISNVLPEVFSLWALLGFGGPVMVCSLIWSF